MDNKYSEHDQPERPYQSRQCMKMFSIGINPAQEDRGVASQMDEHKQKHHHTRNRHQNFSPYLASNKSHIRYLSI
jgi:hypothetical protein